MNKQSKVLISLLLCFVMLLSFTACTPSETEQATMPPPSDTPVTLSQLADYTFVCAENSSVAVKIQVTALTTKLQGITQQDTPAVISDTDAEPVATEVLIGRTNRPESQYLPELGYHDWCILATGQKILICGGSDDATAAAVYQFLNDNIDWMHPEITLAECADEYQADYAAEELTIDGKSITDFSIAAASELSTAAKTAQRQIGTISNKALEIVQETEGPAIQLTVDSSLPSRSWTAHYEEDSLILSGADAYAVVKAVEEVFDAGSVQDGKLEISSDISLEGEYAEDEEKAYLYLTSTQEINQPYMYGSTIKDPTTYAVGETIDYYIACIADNAPVQNTYIWYRYKKDGGEEKEERVFCQNGILQLQIPMEEPGFVMIEAYVCDQYGTEDTSIPRYYGSAAAGFDDIDTGAEEPEDFDEFWAEQVALWDQCDITVLYREEIDSSSEYYMSGYVAYDIHLSYGDDENYVSMVMTMPEDAEPGSLALNAHFRGYGVDSVDPGYNPGTITITVNPHSIENFREDAYYSELDKGKLSGFGMVNTVADDCYFYYMLKRDYIAIQYAKTMPEWNGTDLTTSGGSMGGFQATAMAALDEDVTYLNSSIPWMADLAGNEAADRIIATFRPENTPAVQYFDTAYFAKRVTCSTHIYAGLSDDVCPPTGVAAIYNNLGCEDKNIDWTQTARHGGSAQPLCQSYHRDN